MKDSRIVAMTTIALSTLALLGGCAGPLPAPEKLAALPLVTYPDAPPSGDHVYKLPAGKPIDVRIRADGSALASPVTQTLGASLAHDLYLHKNWASEDGSHWLPADKLIGVNLNVVLPSYLTPGPGDIHLTVDRLPGR